MPGIFSGLTTRVASCLFRRLPHINKSINVLNFELKPPNAATFTSLLPTALNTCSSFPSISKYSSNFLLKPKQVLSTEQIRTVVKFSWKKAERKSVRAVTIRFFRLHWGGWVRTIAGRKKKLWKKSQRQRNRYLQHVLCNATQCRMLDTMVSKFWRKPKYFIDDPYSPYHEREHFPITRRKPWRPDGVDYE